MASRLLRGSGYSKTSLQAMLVVVVVVVMVQAAVLAAAFTTREVVVGMPVVLAPTAITRGTVKAASSSGVAMNSSSKVRRFD